MSGDEKAHEHATEPGPDAEPGRTRRIDCCTEMKKMDCCSEMERADACREPSSRSEGGDSTRSGKGCC